MREKRMTKSTKKLKYKIGTIVAIPLPDGRFAFAKVFKDYDLGVYSFISDKIESVENITKHKIAFFQSTTDTAIKDGQWPKIGEEPFPDDESAWGPPRAAGALPQLELGIVNPMLSHKGVERPAKLQELVGLDIEMFCQRPELFVDIVVDRLIKGNDAKYRVQS